MCSGPVGLGANLTRIEGLIIEFILATKLLFSGLKPIWMAIRTFAGYTIVA
jgi:hypothetical protein